MPTEHIPIKPITNKRPQWTLIFPFLMTAPQLTTRHWHILGILALIGIFNRYDIALFSLAVQHIQDGLSITDGQISTYGAIVITGSIPAFLLFLMADRFGRRRILFISFVGFTAFTGLTGFAINPTQFVILQFLARMFLTTSYILGAVMVTEEFDEAERGWGIGAYGAMIAYGYGAAYPIFALVDILPFGWRTLYLLSFGGFAFVAFIWRWLPESQRYARQSTKTATIQPIVSLIKMYPKRFLMTATVFFIISFGSQAGGFLEIKYLQEVHGWQEASVSLMAIIGGFGSIFLPTAIGRLSDRIGRRWVTTLSLTMYAVCYLIFYNTSGVLLPIFWFGSIVAIFGSNISIATYGTELFPTSYRSTASGAQSLALTLGAVMGLSAESLLFGVVDSHWTAISIMLLTIFLGAIIVYLFFPETSGRKLEDIAPER